MNRKTRAALVGGIRKWRRIVGGRSGDGGDDDCPLCKLFTGVLCQGCPVALKTGKANCKGSPWESWARYCRENPRSSTRGGNGRFRVFDSASRRLAAEMLSFLVGIHDDASRRAYVVTVTRRESRSIPFTVTAAGRKDACSKALQMAFDTEFARAGEAEYEVTKCQENQEEESHGTKT